MSEARPKPPSFPPIAAADAEALYRALFETMGPAVLLMRGPMCIDCNPATLALFGLDSREEFIGKTVLDFAPALQPSGEPSLELVQRYVVEAIQNGAQTFEWQSRRKSGETFLMEVRFAPCGPPEEQLFLCIAMDISERRRAEMSLRASEQRFRAIIERATEGLMVVDAEARQIRYVNPAMCQMLGYCDEELLGLRVEDMHPPEALEAVLAEFDAQAFGAPRDASFPMLRKDGSCVDVSVHGGRLEMDGRLCVFGFFTDMTEQRQLQAERLRAQKLEAIGSLAGGIAHDFNNLLQGVFGYISVAKNASDPELARRMLEESEQALRMAVRLTNQLLTFSRGGTPVTKLVALGPLVRGAAKFALSGSPIAAQFELADELWAVEADEGQIEQVIQNIVLNAVQASPPGGTIEIRAQNVTAPSAQTPTTLGAGRYVAICVTDSGVGISREHLPRIFDPYFTTRARGTGLGLATAYSVVRNHHGMITVRSEVGVGSTFTVFLPASDRPAASTDEGEPELQAPAGRVLVMDDEPTVRSVMTELLNLLGHEVEVANDGAAAVERYRSAREQGRPFDVVIVDLTVPGGMGGLEALAALRAVDPDAWVVVSSGYSDDAAIADYRRHGFSAALRKPFTLEMLSRALAKREPRG